MMPGETQRQVTLSGAPHAIAAARGLIMNMVEARRMELSRGGGGGGGGGGDAFGAGGAGGMGPGGAGAAVRITVPIPDEKVGLVIGKGGANIKAIQSKLGVHINVSAAGECGGEARERGRGERRCGACRRRSLLRSPPITSRGECELLLLLLPLRAALQPEAPHHTTHPSPPIHAHTHPTQTHTRTHPRPSFCRSPRRPTPARCPVCAPSRSRGAAQRRWTRRRPRCTARSAQMKRAGRPTPRPSCTCPGTGA